MEIETDLIPTNETGLVLEKAQPMDTNPAAVYLSSLPSLSGRRSQAQVIRFLADMLGGTPDTVKWEALRYQHTAALRTKLLSSGYAPATIRKYFAAIRGILRHARRLGLISMEDATNASDLGKIEDNRLPSGRMIEDKEIEALFAACAADTTPAGTRDAAILSVMCLVGPRREEIAMLEYKDYSWETGQITFRHAKRNKERVAFISGKGKQALDDWIRLMRGYTDGGLFLAVTRGGTVRPFRKISSQAIYNMIVKRMKEAGLQDISPHDFRRTTISNYLDAGVDVALVAKIVGHSNVTTTARYDRRPDTQKAEAATLLDVPYQGSN